MSRGYLSCLVWVFQLLKCWSLTPGWLNQNCKDDGSGSQPGQWPGRAGLPRTWPVVAFEVLHPINLLRPRHTVKVDYQHIWFSELETGYWHLVARGQGGCRTSSNAEDSPSGQSVTQPKMSAVAGLNSTWLTSRGTYGVGALQVILMPSPAEAPLHIRHVGSV